MRYWILLFILLAVSGLSAQEQPDGTTLSDETLQIDAITDEEHSDAMETSAAGVEQEEQGTLEAAPVLLPPLNVTACDVPNDHGRALDVRWNPPSEGSPSRYILEIAGPDGFFQEYTSTPMMNYRVSPLENRVLYKFRVQAVYPEGRAISEESEPAAPMDHWLILGELPVIITILIYTALLLYFIQAARRGVKLFIRRISGLNAVEDAIGRATEMGKPILYVPGLSSIEDVATLAALNILGEVVRRSVHYDVKIICPNRDPIVFTIAREIMKETYAAEGRPDAFDPNSVFFLVPDQFAFAAGVDGIMVREKPATIFLLGMFWAESLIIAETGASTGAIQIAGTDSAAQLPFFITACDYTLIGEELYAASAYLSNEPMLLGTLKGQDIAKLTFMLVLILFTILALLGIDTVSWVLVR
ncbi:MAG: fibronectin type III domain-containing protein [bacterium]